MAVGSKSSSAASPVQVDVAAPRAGIRAPLTPSPRPILEAELAKFPEPAKPGEPRPFFISAHPRSGTNWLGCLMNLHRKIACTGEFTFHDVFAGVQQLVNAPGRAARFEPTKTVALKSFQRFVRDCMTSLQSRNPRATRVGDHTPRRLRVFLPGAYYIILFRDGRDIAVSWTFNALARKELWVVPDVIKPFFEQQLATFAKGADGMKSAGAALLEHEPWVRHIARQWAQHVRDDLDAHSRFYSGELIGSVEIVRYEDLHTSIESSRERMYALLGLDPADADPVSDQTRTSTTFVKEEDPASHYRRGRVGDWKDKLSPRAVRWVEEEAGTELAELNYTTGEAPSRANPL